MIGIIAKRELMTRGRSKGFIVTTVLLFVVVLAGATGSRLIADDGPRSVTIGLRDSAIDLAGPLKRGDDLLRVTTRSITVDGTALLESGELDVAFDGRSLTWKDTPDTTLDEYIRSVVQDEAVTARAAELGLTRGDVEKLFAPVGIREVRLDGSDSDLGIRLAAAATAGFATFMLLQVWGSFLMMGVVEEKSSKVVEVLLSRVRPATLLAGKVLGLGVLAVGQMSIVVAGLVLGLVLVQDVTIPAEVWATVPLLFLTFLLGFAFYACAYAAVGSMVSRQEDAASAQIPVLFPLLAGYIIGVSSFTAPKNVAVTIGSFVPFTSPVLLPFRTAMTTVPWWQVALSLLILAASSVVMLMAAGRIYRHALLRSGGRVRFSEVWRDRSENPQ